MRIENFQKLVNVASIADAKQRSLISQVYTNQKKGMHYSLGRNMEKKNVPFTMDKGKDKVVRNAVLITPPP